MVIGVLCSQNVAAEDSSDDYIAVEKLFGRGYKLFMFAGGRGVFLCESMGRSNIFSFQIYRLFQPQLVKFML